MNLLQLNVRVAEILEDTAYGQWTSLLIDQYVSDGAADFAIRTKCIKQMSTALGESTYTGDQTNDAPAHAFYDLPDNFLELESVWNDNERIYPVAVANLPDTWRTETGTPAGYIFGDFSAVLAAATTECIRVYPAPTAALTNLTVFYTGKTPVMTNSNDVPTGIPFQYHIALVYYAVARCYERNFEDADTRKAAHYRALYEDQVLDCSSRVARRMSSEPVHVPYRVV